MKIHSISIAKPYQGQVNEDAVIAKENLIAVSDGAGGGGIYAERWSKYLVDCLPCKPLRSFEELDAWIDGIWEPFYNECEELAKREGGLLLDKFYDEGSFATLAAIWIDGNKAHWMTYGDSVAFCYNPATEELSHSFTKLEDFNRPPYLLNYNNPLQQEGCKCGDFDIDDNNILFCATDAQAHYIIMMYELQHEEKFADEIKSAIEAGTKLSGLVITASSLQRDFYKDVLLKLLHCKSKCIFKSHIGRLLKDKLIALDDYSFAYCHIINRKKEKR